MNTVTALMNKKEVLQFYQKCHYEHKRQRNAFFQGRGKNYNKMIMMPMMISTE